ncbi:hypothetical protein [Kutzneria sp. NPDC052558]|uniref:hypothetical protein n=1 Tax=Kutzneria sp. NPDC052558 TaxID=3364121 RepID=UPI0037C630C9
MDVSGRPCNEYEAAIEHYLASLSLSEAVGWGAGEASAFINLGRLDEAAAAFDQALAIADAVDAGYLKCLALIGSSETLHRLGRPNAATHARQAREMAATAGYRLFEGLALAALATATADPDLQAQAAAILAESGYAPS